MSKRRKIRFGLIGLGLMGREFASSVARWCNLLADLPRPEIVAICSADPAKHQWYPDNFPSIKLVTADYRELLASKEVDAVYCAVPHHLHASIYCDVLAAGKHLLAEKPFGIDLAAADRIMAAVAAHPDLVVRCSSEFPYFPGAQQIVAWQKEHKFGRIMEVRAGFHHASDLDLDKPINWKRQVEFNGEYGAMGDLGLHVLHLPLRFGWRPESVYAELQNLAETRPDGHGRTVPCATWDNCTLLCRCRDQGQPFVMQLETKRMMPGATNTWFLEVYGTKGSAKFSTHDPKAFRYSENAGKLQPWSRLDLGMSPVFPVATGGIFEFGFSDCFQQMLAAFMAEFAGALHPFPMATPQEAHQCHRIFTAALESNRTGQRIPLP